jgi:hypothetical protein
LLLIHTPTREEATNVRISSNIREGLDCPSNG